jgi:two-component system, chemotaxis family, sensor histidine kinase and response regulator WspE
MVQSSLFSVFLSQLKPWIECCEKWLDGSKDTSLEDLMKPLAEIKGACQLISMNDYGEVFDVLLAVLKKLDSSEEEQQKILKIVVDQSCELVELPFDEVDKWYEGNQKSFKGFRKKYLEESKKEIKPLKKRKPKNFLKDFYDRDLQKIFKDLEGKLGDSVKDKSKRFEVLSDLLSAIEFLKKSVVEDFSSVIQEFMEMFQKSISALIRKEIRWTSGRYKDWLKGIRLINLGLEKGFENLSDSSKEFESITNVYKSYFSQTVEEPKKIFKKPLESLDVPEVDESIWELFLAEVDHHSSLLEECVLEIERQGSSDEVFNSLMRAAHSLKGASKVVGLSKVVNLAHALEGYFTDIQKGKRDFLGEDADEVLSSIDCFKSLTTPKKELEIQGELEALIDYFQQPAKRKRLKERVIKKIPSPVVVKKENKPIEENLKIKAQTLTDLINLSGELLVKSKGGSRFKEILLEMKNNLSSQEIIAKSLINKATKNSSEELQEELEKLQKQIQGISWQISEKIEIVDRYNSQSEHLVEKLYHTSISSRLRPFSEGVKGFPRMIRDLARSLEKKVSLIIEGGPTTVDREVLEQLEAPLTHLLRNALDHGIESPAARKRAGKDAEGKISLRACHLNGRLNLIIQDDGKGIDWDSLKRKVVEKKYATPQDFDKLSMTEKAGFLFLPGLSTAEKTTEVSGRGVGLDAVKKMVNDLEGSISIESEQGLGTTFFLELPITLSVINTLLVEVAGESYAFPLSSIENILTCSKEDINKVGEFSCFSYKGKKIGIANGCELLEFRNEGKKNLSHNIVLIKDQQDLFGFEVEHFLGETQLVIQKFNPLIGDIKNISSGAVLEDGNPVLIFDMEGLKASLRDYFCNGNARVSCIKTKTVLVAEDSQTVRKEEVDLLRSMGFSVIEACNGAEAWTLLRTKPIDLLITDLDMPQLNGIELLSKLRSSGNLKDLPAMVVSYQDYANVQKELEALKIEAFFGKQAIKDGSLKEKVLEFLGEPLLTNNSKEVL